ncbi:MAG: hypothetical protein V2A74_03295, partial [bacterium]
TRAGPELAMKKFLIGCGIVALIGGICLFVMCSFVGYKMASIAKSFGETSQTLATLEKEHPFEAPENYELNPERYRAYLSVRHRMLSELRSSQIVQKLAEASRGGGRANINPLEIFGFMGSVPQYVKSLAEALNESKMPPSEYLFNFRATLATFRGAALSGESGAKEKWDVMRETIERHPVVTQSGGNASREAKRLSDLLEKEKEIPVSAGNIELIRGAWGEFDDLRFATNAELYLVLTLLATTERSAENAKSTSDSTAKSTN